MTEPLLSVRRLTVHYARRGWLWRGAALAAVRDVSFDLARGETLGLVGESGSGKSSIARAIMRLVPAAHGEVRLLGRDLLRLDPAPLRAERRRLQMVFQDPFASLDPRMSVGEILAEPLILFDLARSRGERAAEVRTMLGRVGLDPAMARRFPHEFSGGQCQRIAIARAMMPRPELLICDEPVSSLDVSVQGQILNLLRELQRERGMAMLFISHNLAVVRHLCSRVLVLYFGAVAESAPADALFRRPRHPYTRALIAALPQLHGGMPAPLAGEMPSPLRPPVGCAFQGRCVNVETRCREREPPWDCDADHGAACWRARELAAP